MRNSILLADSSCSAAMAAGVLQEDKWRLAGRCALANSGIYLLMAALIYAAKPESLGVILSAPAVFFAGSLLTFALMVQSGAALAPLTWFVLGAGIYFGLGSVAGGLRVHPYSEQIFGADILYLTQVNLLNACSVLIVVGVALAFGRTRRMTRQAQGGALVERDGLLQKVFPYVLALAAAGVFLKFAFFPMADNLLMRSITGKLNLFIPACILLLGLLWQRLDWPLKIAALTLFILEVLNGLLVLSKYQVIYVMLALVMGQWLIRASWRSMLSTMMGLVLVFAVINPLITLGRAHLAYDAQKNTLETRMEILRDACGALLDSDVIFWTAGAGDINERVNLKEMSKPEQRLRAIGRRFEVASIQGYLINEYNNGHPGNTLSNFWVTFIPRMFWPQKPVITNLGVELNAKYYNDPTQIYSALAPTYSAEAYWNFGPSGVVLVSVLLGLAIGWLTHYSFLAVSGQRPEYFIVAFSVAIWACWVESWLVSSYLGEFVIFVGVLLIARVLLKCHSYLKNKKAWLSPRMPSNMN